MDKEKFLEEKKLELKKLAEKYGLNQKEFDFALAYLFLTKFDEVEAVKIVESEVLSVLEKESTKKDYNLYLQLSTDEYMAKTAKFIKEVRSRYLLEASVDKLWIVEQLKDIAKNGEPCYKLSALKTLTDIVESTEVNNALEDQTNLLTQIIKKRMENNENKQNKQ